jgi:hypothetical protein
MLLVSRFSKIFAIKSVYLQLERLVFDSKQLFVKQFQISLFLRSEICY